MQENIERLCSCILVHVTKHATHICMKGAFLWVSRFDLFDMLRNTLPRDSIIHNRHKKLLSAFFELRSGIFVINNLTLHTKSCKSNRAWCFGMEQRRYLSMNLCQVGKSNIYDTLCKETLFGVSLEFPFFNFNIDLVILIFMPPDRNNV